MNSKQLDLFDELTEARLYHEVSGYGYFAILTRNEGEFQQSSHVLTQLPSVIELLPKGRDTWLSQAEFIRPNRRVVNLLRIGLAFVDLDTYRTVYRNVVPESIAQSLGYYCDDNLIPQPSVILFSGQGLHVKWLFEKAVPRHALPRWNAVQKTLVETLNTFGADKQAKDASRVLRLVNTVNSKTGEIVRALHVEEINGQPLRYDFDLFADDVLPYTREQTVDYKKRQAAQLKALPGGKPGNLKSFSGRRLAWHRLEDLRTLAKLRGWDQTGVPEGFRDLYLFWSLNFLLLSGATHARQMYDEAEALAREVCPGFIQDHNLSTLLSTLYRKARAYEAGETIEFNGKKYPPLYTPKNSTLMDVFEITGDEERKLRTIISGNEAIERRRERDRERNRVVEDRTRMEYLVQAERKRQEAIRLRKKGMNKYEIARELGISRRAVYHYLKR